MLFSQNAFPQPRDLSVRVPAAGPRHVKGAIAGAFDDPGAGNGTRTRECQLGKLMPASPSPFKNNPLELVLYWMSKLKNLAFGKKFGKNRKALQKKRRPSREDRRPSLWSGRRDSNPRIPAWEAGALPLGDARARLCRKDRRGDSIPCQFSWDKASPRKRARSARKRLMRRPPQPCPCSGSRVQRLSTVCTRHRGRGCTTGSRGQGRPRWS